MKDCITTLPISPIINPNIGVLVAPFVMDVLGKKMGIKRVLSLNVSGLKLQYEDKDTIANFFVDDNKNLGIVPDYIWHDESVNTIYWLNHFFQKLMNSGHLILSKEYVIECPCGIVESLANADNVSEDKKLYKITNEKKYCNFCNKAIVRRKKNVCLFRFPDIKSEIFVYPDFYKRELFDIIDKFSGVKFLISKSRKSSRSLVTIEENITLDVDFVWQMLVSFLLRDGYDVKVLIGSNKNLLSCCFMVALAKLIDDKHFFIIIPPYYLAQGKRHMTDDIYSLSHLLSDYDAKTIRLSLASAFNWNRKATVLDLELMNLISKMSYRISAKDTEKINLRKCMERLHGIEIKKLLAKIRRSSDNFFCSELYGLI